ncbi:MAG: fibronectin type III domain-containing protein [Candidatus Krumholzibacteriota bacterium]|nr:fibronectin type III domain-containing protein [Candidatus Krumholzibacteriota bacterium]
MKRIAVLGLIISTVFTIACSNEHGDSPTAFKYDPPASPTDLTATDGVGEIDLQWNYPPSLMGEISGFIVYYHVAMYGILEPIDTVENVTSFKDENLPYNYRFCYLVSALDTSGLEGWRMGPVCGNSLSP